MSFGNGWIIYGWGGCVMGQAYPPHSWILKETHCKYCDIDIGHSRVPVNKKLLTGILRSITSSLTITQEGPGPFGRIQSKIQVEIIEIFILITNFVKNNFLRILSKLAIEGSQFKYCHDMDCLLQRILWTFPQEGFISSLFLSNKYRFNRLIIWI